MLNGIAGKFLSFFAIKCHSLPFSDQRERMSFNVIKVGCAECGRLSGGEKLRAVRVVKDVKVSPTLKSRHP